MKKPQHSSFKFSPVAVAVAMALTSQFAANVAQAGSGYGSGVTNANVPNAVPTFYANSPSGPAPQWNGGVLQQRVDGSALPVTAQSGTLMRKFVDTLPGFGKANANNLGQYIPVGVPEKWIDPNGVKTADDYYEIAAVEFTEKMHSDLPKATKLRGYVQLETAGNAATSAHIALTYPNGTAITDPAKVTLTNPTGQVFAYDNPHHLGPVITGSKGTAVRVKFTNYLPIGGKMFLPLDTTLPGAGFGPDGVTPYGQNRAGMHLVGGQAPWISAGSPHQWVAPVGEVTPYAKGDSSQSAPDMLDPGNGSVNLVFPNDMSARFTFIQDRTSGMTRLNAYAGLEAAYVVTDPIEQMLISGGTLSGGGLKTPLAVAAGTLPAAQIPLIIEDKTFVPANIGQQDTLWNDPNWGGPGDLWFPHVYEPNQDPTQAGGANPVGRWDYGPLFWPIFPVHPAKVTLPSPSHVPEAYHDTPVINGTAYPTLTVEPKAYRVRLLNASNDRFVNLGLYTADPSLTVAPLLDANGNPVVNAAGVQQFMTGTEVKMVPAAPIDTAGSPPGWDVVNGVQKPLPQLAASVDAAGNPLFPWNINAEPSGPTRAWPVDGRAGGAPDPTTSGPDFIVIGNDGGLLPQGVDIPSQPVTYEQNRRSITVTNIYGYGLLLGPSERADTIVDFSAFAGQTLILYNDAPAPTPFNDPRDDYYTGNPDLSTQGGAYSTLPGYGPNTRTMMQIKVGTSVTSGGPLNAAALAAALPAAYAASQPQPIVPEVAYNAAFGTTDTDNYARVATGSAAQPSLIVNHTGTLDLVGFSLITSGGAGTGSGSGYKTPPTVVLTNAPGDLTGNGATASATLNAAGQVSGVTLTSVGSNYTSAPTVTFVSGNSLNGIVVTDGGSGYTAPVTVTLDGGGLAAATVVPATVVLSLASPISTTPVANSLVGGSGYLVPPTVSFTGGAPGTGATGTATISTSPLAVASVQVTNAGSGYTAATTALVSAPQTTGTTATATPIVGFAVAPIATFATPITTGFDLASVGVSFNQPTYGTQAQGTLVIDTTGSVTGVIGAILGINVTSGGSGYTAAATATIADGAGGTPVTVAAPIAPASGQIFGATIVNAGSGYTAPATISFSTGTGASATVGLSGPAGSVTGLTITSGGGGYTAVPSVVFTDVTPVSATHIAATPAAATVALATAHGAITGVTLGSFPVNLTSVPNVSLSGGGSGATAVAGIGAAGVGAQATMLTSTTTAIPVLTKAEQELFDDYGRYNSTGGVELPFTTAAIQTTIPAGYIDAPTEILGDDELQIWKLVDNGLWSNSIHFSGWDVQLINRVGWDGTVKAPASNEFGWKDTIRLNPLEDAIVAMRAKVPKVNFGQPRSTRLQDPTKPAGIGNFPVAPTMPVAGTQYASGLGFLADPNVVTQAGTMNSKTVGVGKVLLATSTNTAALVGSTTGNFDNEFVWGSAILGHAENDLTRPVVFNPLVSAPSQPTALADLAGNGTLSWTDPTPVASVTTPANPQNEIGFKVQQAPITNLATYALGAFTPVFAAVPANVVGYKEPAALVAPNLPQYYAYQVVAYNAAGDSTPSNFVYEAPPKAPTLGNGIPLLTPSFITPPTSTTDVKLTLQWQDNSDNETNYIITKTGGPGAVLANGKVTGGSTSTLTAPSNLATPSTNTTFVDPAALVEGEAYQYDVIARNSFGDSVAPILTGTLVAPISVPLAPTNLLATPNLATCSASVPVRCKPDDVVLTWTDSAFNETSYTVARTGGNVAFATVTLPASAVNAAPAQMTFKDATAQEGLTYQYTVSAVNASGAASATGIVTVTPTVPTLPTNLVATPSTALDANGTYVDTVALSWSDNAYNEASYQVYRDGNPVGNPIVGAGATNNPMGTASVGWTASPTLTYTDSGVGDGTTHTWTVAAINNVALPGNTGVNGTMMSAGATKTMPGKIIAPPSALTVTPNSAGSSIRLCWTNNANNETDFLVEESVSNVVTAPGMIGAWTVPTGSPMASTTGPGNQVCFSRTNVPTTPGNVYTFRLTARDVSGVAPRGAGHSDSHPYAYAQASLNSPPLPAAPVLTAPTVTFNTTTGTDRVRLTWNKLTPVANTTMSYLVFANGIQIAAIGQPGGTGTTVTYTYVPTAADLLLGIKYTVESVQTAIRTANQVYYGSSTSVISNTQALTPAPAAAVAPTGLAATTNATSGVVTANWGAVAAPTGSTVSYVVTSVVGTTTRRQTLTTNSGTLTIVPNGSTYQVTVAAIFTTAQGVATEGPASTAITVNTMPAQSTGLTLTLPTTRNFAVNWTNTSTNLTGWNIQRGVVAANGTTTWTTITPTVSNTAGTTAYSFSDGVGAAGSYRYRVAAKSAVATTANVTSAIVHTN